MSHNKGFHFLDVYWAFNEKPHLFKDGLHLNGEGAGILGTSVSIATQVFRNAFLDQKVSTLPVRKWEPHK